MPDTLYETPSEAYHQLASYHCNHAEDLDAQDRSISESLFIPRVLKITEFGRLRRSDFSHWHLKPTQPRLAPSQRGSPIKYAAISSSHILNHLTTALCLRYHYKTKAFFNIITKQTIMSDPYNQYPSKLRPGLPTTGPSPRATANKGIHHNSLNTAKHLKAMAHRIERIHSALLSREAFSTGSKVVNTASTMLATPKAKENTSESEPLRVPLSQLTSLLAGIHHLKIPATVPHLSTAKMDTSNSSKVTDKKVVTPMLLTTLTHHRAQKASVVLWVPLVVD